MNIHFLLVDTPMYVDVREGRKYIYNDNDNENDNETLFEFGIKILTFTNISSVELLAEYT